MYFMSVFWAGYLIFFSTTFAFTFAEGMPNMEPYHVLNSGLIFVLALDFLSRFLFKRPYAGSKALFIYYQSKRAGYKISCSSALGLTRLTSYGYSCLFHFAIITVTKYYGVMG